MKRKYQENVLHRQICKEICLEKYRKNVLHRQTMGNEWEEIQTIEKYHKNELHSQKVNAISTSDYHRNAEHKKQVLAGNKLRMQQMKENASDIDLFKQPCLDNVKDGPDFVFWLFRHQVVTCKKEDYNQRQRALITDDCCQWLATAIGQLWICYTCHFKISKGQVPPECVINNQRVGPILPELPCLNSLELHLTALPLHLLLPKSGQNVWSDDMRFSKHCPDQ